jgi:hypothetical protein
MHVMHGQGAELLQHAAGRQARGFAPQLLAQAYMEAIGQETDQDVRLNPVSRRW